MIRKSQKDFIVQNPKDFYQYLKKQTVVVFCPAWEEDSISEIVIKIAEYYAYFENGSIKCSTYQIEKRSLGCDVEYIYITLFQVPTREIKLSENISKLSGNALEFYKLLNTDNI